MKNKVLVMVLAMVLVFSCTAAAFADSGDVGVMPLDTNSVYFVINRTSGTTADATVDVTFTRIADEYSVVVYLQKLVNGKMIVRTMNMSFIITALTRLAAYSLITMIHSPMVCHTALW